jgi:hypothetical protein
VGRVGGGNPNEYADFGDSAGQRSGAFRISAVARRLAWSWDRWGTRGGHWSDSRRQFEMR